MNILVNILRGEYSPIFTKPETDNCFSIITLVIFREKTKTIRKMSFWGGGWGGGLF